MIVASFTEFRRRLAHYMDRADQDRDVVLVTRQGAEPAVLIAQRDYESMLETLYLRRSPANAKRLDESIAEFEAGRGFEVDLDKL